MRRQEDGKKYCETIDGAGTRRRVADMQALNKRWKRIMDAGLQKKHANVACFFSFC